MKVAIVGIGIHPFGRTPGSSGLQQGAYAARAALADAGVRWRDVQFAFGGSYSAGNADALGSELGLTGIPFINVLNGCATGGSSLIAACQQIVSGAADLGLVVGFDKHDRGAFNAQPSEYGLGDWYGQAGMMVTTQFFAMKLQRYLHDHRVGADTLVRIAEKAYRNGALNPNAWRRTPIGFDEIKHSTMVNDPLTKFMFCSPAEGAVALVVCREDRASRYSGTPVFVSAAAMRTRMAGAFEVYAPAIALDDPPNATALASRAAYEMAGLGPKDIDVASIQDTESGAELMHMAENGFCEHGEQERMLAGGETEITGRLPINTDGGCLANGEPIGASGLRQVHEIVLQLRGAAGARQVPRPPRTGYTHVYGAPGVSAVTILQT
ncbi:MAG TPA: thiolase family protein [Steroidobacteraceae bacterium]|nr:thiolase family protein [Steroidobacteraceae bacterium]